MPRFNSLEVRLHTSDFARSVTFYRDVLGFVVESTFPDDTPSFALMSRDGVGLQIGGPSTGSGQGIDTYKAPDAPPTCTLNFDADDALGMFEALKSKVTIEWGPEVYFYHRREFAFRDPDGHLVIVSEETDDPVTSDV